MPKGSSKQRWGEWSEWTWEAERQFYYRVRQDADGNYDYDYDFPKETVPRASVDEDVENVRERLARFSHSSDSKGSPEYKVHASRPSANSGKTRSSGSSKGKEKRHHGYEDKKESSRDTRRQVVEEEEEIYTGTSAAGGGYPTSDTYYLPQDQYTSGSSSQQGYEAIDPRYSTSSSTQDPAFATTSYEGYGASAGPSSSAYAYASYDQANDDGRLTPKPGSSINTAQMVAEAPEALDPRYRVERSDRFQPGEIFKASWAEPKGSANEVLTGLSGKQEIEDVHGVTFITGFRRFIVIANDQGHSTCVPILSYGNKACTKHGVKPEKHGIIYQRGHRPKLLDKEPKLGFPPVKVDMTMEGEKLSKESRVNYSKLVTVEHNVKVMFIGTIVATDWPIVPDAINRCWDQKDHHNRRRHRK